VKNDIHKLFHIESCGF